MPRFLKIVLFLSLCITGLYHLPVKEGQLSVAEHSNAILEEVLQAFEDTESIYPVWSVFTGDAPISDDAAHLHRRYHESLAAFCPASLLAGLTNGWPPQWLRDKIIYGIPFNSSCLSSCYSYIFLLSPF